MAVYRFRVTFEDYDEVIREIDILSKQSFLDLHEAIHRATGYPHDKPSSFYISNDQWKKGQEIAYLPTNKKKSDGVVEMETARLSKFVNDPHQKFYYTYNFERPYDFHVQLIKILKEEEGQSYPLTFRSQGAAPKLFGSAVVPSEDGSSGTPVSPDEYDFLNETQYGIDEEADLDLMSNEDGEDMEGSSEGDFEDEY